MSRAVTRTLHELAAEARAAGNARGIDEVRMARLRAHLRDADNAALAAWLEFRRAQELEAAAAEVEQRQHREVTVLERPRRR